MYKVEYFFNEETKEKEYKIIDSDNNEIDIDKIIVGATELLNEIYKEGYINGYDEGAISILKL